MKQSGELLLDEEPQELVVQALAGDLVEGARTARRTGNSSGIERQRTGERDRAYPHAAGQLLRQVRLEAAEPDQVDRPRSLRRPFGLGHVPSSARSSTLPCHGSARAAGSRPGTRTDAVGGDVCRPSDADSRRRRMRSRVDCRSRGGPTTIRTARGTTVRSTPCRAMVPFGKFISTFRKSSSVSVVGRAAGSGVWSRAPRVLGSRFAVVGRGVRRGRVRSRGRAPEGDGRIADHGACDEPPAGQDDAVGRSVRHRASVTLVAAIASRSARRPGTGPAAGEAITLLAVSLTIAYAWSGVTWPADTSRLRRLEGVAPPDRVERVGGRCPPPRRPARRPRSGRGIAVRVPAGSTPVLSHPCRYRW